MNISAREVVVYREPNGRFNFSSFRGLLGDRMVLLQPGLNRTRYPEGHKTLVLSMTEFKDLVKLNREGKEQTVLAKLYNCIK